MKRFYRNIIKSGKYCRIYNKGEFYLNHLSLREALYERDRFESVDWDWDLYLELPETPNKYEDMDLPEYDRNITYITKVPERWVVVTKGRPMKYIRTYYNKKEAEKYCELHPIYRFNYQKTIYRVQKTINGITIYFGNYDTFEEAEKRVEELKNNGWDGYELSVE